MSDPLWFWLRKRYLGLPRTCYWNMASLWSLMSNQWVFLFFCYLNHSFWLYLHVWQGRRDHWLFVSLLTMCIESRTGGTSLFQTGALGPEESMTDYVTLGIGVCSRHSLSGICRSLRLFGELYSRTCFSLDK